MKIGHMHEELSSLISITHLVIDYHIPKCDNLHTPKRHSSLLKKITRNQNFTIMLQSYVLERSLQYDLTRLLGALFGVVVVELELRGQLKVPIRRARLNGLMLRACISMRS